MAYIGNEPVIGQWRKLDDISGSFNGSLTSFTTQVGGTNVTAGSANQLLVSLGGVLQEPGTDYSVSSSTITFTTAPAASLSFFAVLGGDALNTSVPADGSITTAKLGSNLTVDLDLGSAASPSLTFDADSGLFSGGDNQVAVSTNGVERVEFGASEVVFNDGGANYDFRVEGDTNANLLFVDASTDRVGIGTSSPSDVFHVEGTIRTSSSTNSAQFANNFLRASASGTFFFDQSTVGQSFQYRVSNASANDTTALTITSAGRVGIGTTSPTQTLSLGGNLAFQQSSNLTTTTGFLNISATSTLILDGADTHFRIGGTERARIDSSGRLLVGTNSDFTGSSAFQLQVARSGAANIALANTTSAPTSGTTVGQLNVYSNVSSTFSRVGKAYFTADGTHSSTSRPTFYSIDLVPSGSTALTERFRINSSGGISCFGTAAAHGFRATQTAGTDSILFVQNGSSSVTTGSNVFIVRADGDVENATGNYTAFSDQRFKENILDAGSQWGDIKSIQIKKFNFKESTGLATHTQIGVIAQELEQVCPNLVKTVLPADNTDAEDEAYKTVKLSVLYMKAVKALQEAMERIETLEAKVAALEAN